ncbi:MAG: FAD-binding monooxygenase [Robiginitomaculum sp.]|nr:MAG: FAD-binding monooxygenase [Robiginitomaculum sp.]
MKIYDVCIVGFGPTGAVTASLLANAGHSVIVVDRLTEVYDKPRAIALDHEIMRVFQNMGIIDDILPYVAEYPPSEYVGVDGDIIKRLDVSPPPYPQGWAPNYSFTQPPVERLLRKSAEDAGVTILLGHEFVSLQDRDEKVTVSLRDPEDKHIEYHARYVIGADGANSTVRRLCGLELIDLVFDEPWLVVDVQVNEETLSTLPDVNVQYCEPKRPGTYVVGPANHRRWEIMLNEDECLDGSLSPERVWELLKRWITPKTANLWRSATYRFHAVVASKWRRGRVLLAGDAAHQQPPFLGQGMCQGVRDAVNLSWKLDLVLRKQASENLLDTYGEERRTHVTALMNIIKALGRFIGERDVNRARERDKKALADMGGTVVTTSRQDIMPALSVGVLSTQKNDGRGTLFPQPRLIDGSLLDDSLGQGLRLILSGDTGDFSPKKSMVPEGLTIARVFEQTDAQSNNSVVSNFVEAEGVVTSWFRKNQAVAALVRPDNYIFGTAEKISDVSDLIVQYQRAVTGIST